MHCNTAAFPPLLLTILSPWCFFDASAGLQSVTCLQLLRTVNRLSCRLALCISASCQLDLCWPASVRPSGCGFYSNSLLGWRLGLMPSGLSLITEHKTNTMLRSLARFLAFWDDPGWCRAIRMDYLPVLLGWFLLRTVWLVFKQPEWHSDT